MANLPESVLSIVEKFATDYPNLDDGKAVEKSEAAIRKLEEFAQIADVLITNAVRDLVYDARNNYNRCLKRETGYYESRSAKAKVTVGGETLKAIYRSVYLYNISGKTLGGIIGSEIDPLIVHERAESNGHLFNAELLEWVKAQGVVGSKSVQSVIPEKKLRREFDRLYQKNMQREAM